MDTADEVPFSALLEMWASDGVETGGLRRSGGLALGGIGFGDEWAVSDTGVV